VLACSSAPPCQAQRGACCAQAERTARVRGLVARTAEALALLQLLTAHNLGRLSLRLDERSRRTLANLVGAALPQDPLRHFPVP
jgi:hypothetical protein